MLIQEILNSVGQFSAQEAFLFEQHTSRRVLHKHEVLLNEGQTCQSVYFVLSGSFYQYQVNELSETIIDLHLPTEWMFNHASLIGQKASTTIIKAFSKAEVIELSLNKLHSLMAVSPAFLKLASIFDQAGNRTYLFDHSLTPAQKYAYINKVKPLITQVFPVKMIASYLKLTPETLSRVRAKPSIS